MQHKPRMGGIIVTAVLLVLVLVMATTFGSMSASGASTMKMSEVMNYFAANQVTYFNLDLNTGVIDLSLKEGQYPLPDNAEEASQPSGGFLTSLTDEDSGPQNGGIVSVTYKLPYTAYFLQYVQQYIDAYNEANPDAPMVYDMVGLRTSIPWFEILLYA